MPKQYRQQWRIVGWVHWLWFKCGFKAHAGLDWAQMGLEAAQQEHGQAIKDLWGATEQLNAMMDRIIAAHFRQKGDH